MVESVFLAAECFYGMHPQRIISLVPSQTELLFELGLDEELVGITKFCVYPADKVGRKPVVGGTKSVHLDRIHALKPDLIIANKEENDRAQIETLQRHYAVHVTDVVTLADVLAMIRELGSWVGKFREAQALAERIETTLCPLVSAPMPPTVAYFIWRDPYMVAANDTFIHTMLGVAGFRNAFAHRTRYPTITGAELQAAQPDLVFLSSEPYPFALKHQAEFEKLCPSARVVLVDGEMFSWYGSRLLRAADYFNKLQAEIAHV